MGGVSDGRYIYISMTKGSNVDVYQLDPLDNFSVVSNKSIIASGSGDWKRMFVKDGLLYCTIESGKTYSIALGEDGTGFASNEFALTELPFAGTSVTWNEALGRYAVLNGGTVSLYDESGALVTAEGVTNTFNPTATGSVSSISSDEKYIYVSFKSDGQTNIPIEIYDWNGNHVASCAPNSASYPADGFNVQSLFEYNGSMYATVCSFGTAGYYMHVWAITPVA